MSTVGMKRCHFVTPDGAAHQLVPDPKSAEGRRIRLDREHPALSRGIGVASVLLLLVGVILLVFHIAEPISRTPPIAEHVGVFTSPVDLPLWLDITLGIGAVLGSTERALRLRHHWLLDTAGT